jgi:pimeloyl-ACP methyl ester carboxylesterase
MLPARQGQGSDPEGGRVPFVLLHGLSQQRHYWTPVQRRLTGRPVVTVDQRGHGEAATAGLTPDSDFSMDRLADDVVAVLDALEIPSAIVVGHSWGASVALRTAVRHSERVRSAVLLDGGLFGPRHLVDDTRSIEQVREQLRPPPLGMLEPVLWQAISSGDLSPYWTEDIRAALEPTFIADDSGRVFTRIGMERHMAVLDGLIAYDPTADVQQIACPTWLVSCEPRISTPLEANETDEADLSAAWLRARSQTLVDLPSTFFLQRWFGALHDVPLQWPAMVAGLLETVAERIEPPREDAKEERVSQ